MLGAVAEGFMVAEAVVVGTAVAADAADAAVNLEESKAAEAVVAMASAGSADQPSTFKGTALSRRNPSKSKKQSRK